MSERSTLYLDIDDDITAIIGKLKKAQHPEVALVAPKRSNVLNSAVNLKLIKKSAKSASKTPVLITDDSAIGRLASGLNMLVAPNLKAEPAVPDIPKAAEGSIPSDTIEGETVGTPAAKASAEKAQQTYQVPSAVAKSEGDAKPAAAAIAAEEAGEKKSRVPDFNRFKKHLLLGFGGLVLFVLLLLALFFWLPKATIAINGTTEGLGLNFKLTADSNAKSADNSQALLPAKAESLEKTLTATFNATGKKDLGSKAAGTISISQCVDSDASSYSAGTKFSANGKTFTANQGFAVSGAKFSGGGCSKEGTGSVAVSAIENGDSYNLGATSYTSTSVPSSYTISGTQMSGGSSKIATVVTQADIDAAKNQQLETQRSTVHKELDGRFASEQYIIKESYTEDVKSTTSAPALDQEGSTATLTLKVTYSQLAVERKQLEDLIKQQAKEEAKKKDNKALGVVDSGLDKATFKPVSKTATAQDFELKSDVLLGPDINFDELRERVGGKNFSDTVEIVKGYPNVTDVEVKFSPFYVRSVPKRPAKIDIKIEVPR